MTTRQHFTLADGRDIFYFDLKPGQDRSAPDTRELPETATSSQIRWDPLFSEWAVVAGHRQSRTYKPPAELCPLDPTRDANNPTEIPAPDYDVVVFENRFPSLTTDAAASFPDIHEFPFRSGPGAGRCEVVCFTSDHDTSFAQLDSAHARTVFDALADRTAELSTIESIAYVFCFENRGEEIGVTLSHPHGQIYGYPFVPPRMRNAAETAAAYERDHGACLRCELLQREIDVAERIVVRTEHWTALVPFAARWPYEVRIIANRHVPDLPALNDAERDDLAEIYLDVLRRFDGLFDTPAPYIAGWHQAPIREFRDSWHLGAEIFTIRRAPGKLKYLAGSESGAAVWINDVSPEIAAARLRGEPV
ncbi:galactose-1-phosphate uridylyltransferase [Jatrophihabitans telluris]|uniref:Galactose-1-phosphate uridylyltransferase n=1 Tax=Jatrophihabitans telluris TaxID=2038343 RepID=A0ABY4QZN1_9ACTN|nr:galactose-1-phosphate uridylyltransferase [Jatrophihabitans telluris]UQX89111.1 galactose-1-phosphate uridylyltransferase [Jatrophihabitans telluris]